ncbi:MAG: site-specific integrase, partial [Cellulomonas sp.]|nr:site-specific integrase [Cellulomonas sp.]
ISERARIVTECAKATGKPATGLLEEDVVAWLTTPSFSPGTRQKYYGAVHTWSSHLQRAGVRPDDPTENLRSPRVPRRQPRPVADEGLELVLGSRMHHRTRVMLHLMAYQGLRRHEVAKFRGEDIDLIAGTVTVVGKGGVVAVNPLHEVIAADAASMPRRGWWFPAYPHPTSHVQAHSVGGVVARAIRRAGVNATGHQLRHWFGTSLLGSGVDVRIVQELMRHASLNTTALYTKVHADQQRAGLARLRPLAEQPHTTEVRKAA